MASRMWWQVRPLRRINHRPYGSLHARTTRAAHLLSQRLLRATAAEAHPHLERRHGQARTRCATGRDEAPVRLPPAQPVQG